MPTTDDVRQLRELLDHPFYVFEVPGGSFIQLNPDTLAERLPGPMILRIDSEAEIPPGGRIPCRDSSGSLVWLWLDTEVRVLKSPIELVTAYMSSITGGA